MSQRKAESGKNSGLGAFLRSINIVLDAVYPERVSHLRPTGKSIRYLRALLEQGDVAAWLVAAPYGSGKSLVTSFGMHCVENLPGISAVTSPVVKRIETLSPPLAKAIRSRMRSKKRGLAIPIHGHSQSVAASLRDALADALHRQGHGAQAGGIRRRRCDSIEDAISILDDVVDQKIVDDVDQLLIVWDEFGRHLETLASEGRAAVLLDIQVLAEWAARVKDVHVRFAVLLHQGMLNYAASLPEAARREWSKIEGRFERLEFVDDSIEIARLVSELIEGARPEGVRPPSKAKIRERVRALRECDLYTDCSIDDAVSLAQSAYPLTLSSLYLLPRVASRVSQNERTIFSFVHALDYERPADPSVVYQYFASAMRSDTAPGGTYRQWIEAESAAAKVESGEALRVLRTCALLGLGFTGKRSRVNRSLLMEASWSPDDASESIRLDSVIDELVNAKLLLHRRHSDEVSIWHGTDADLRTRQQDMREEAGSAFDIVGFLATEFPPPVWRPTEFNDNHRMRRYFRSQYVNASDLVCSDLLSPLYADLADDDDGRIYLVLPSSTKELAAAREVAVESTDSRVIFAIPSGVASVQDAAIDVWAIMRLHHDEDLLGSDPLVGDELRIMEDDARGHLADVLGQAYRPGSNLSWYHLGVEVKPDSAASFRHWLSEVAIDVFSNTPVVNNEVINRKKPSAVIVNARKKLIEAILESDGVKDLNFGEGGKYEVGASVEAIYRGVLKHTGVYGCDKAGRWGFRHPRHIDDPGLRKAWECFRKHFVECSDTPKSFAGLFRTLQLPPIGMRAGVIPIFMAAAIRTFQSSAVLTCDNEYVEDITPSAIEDLCRDPGRFKITVVDLTPPQRKFLDGVYELFVPSASYVIDEPDSLRRCMEAIEAWIHGLSSASRQTRRLSDRAMAVRSLLFRKRDPVRLLLGEIPAALGGEIKPRGVNKLLGLLADAKCEVEGIVGDYMSDAKDLFGKYSGMSLHCSSDGFRAAALDWAGTFPFEYVRSLESPAATALIATANRDHEDDDTAMNAMAVALYGRAIRRWQDEDVRAFADKLREVVRDLEDGIIAAVESDQIPNGAEEQVAMILETKLLRIAAALSRCRSKEQVAALVSDVIDC